ncbi:MAG: WhiB family transcriptional regulator [Ilumatobacteraceae bacterium]
MTMISAPRAAGTNRLGGISSISALFVGADPDETVAPVRARCADGHGSLSHLFFSDDDHDLARAKSICGPCRLRRTCVSGAVERAERYGVWGGKIFVEGEPVEFRRKRGRPKKCPDPVLTVDEVPVPPHLVA